MLGVLLSTIRHQAYLSATFDFAGNYALVFRANPGFFARQDFVLTAGITAQGVCVAKSNVVYLLDAE